MPGALDDPRLGPVLAAIKPQWDKLGVLTDREIGRRTHLSGRDVRVVRELAGIPPAPGDTSGSVQHKAVRAGHLQPRTPPAPTSVGVAGSRKRFAPWMRVVGLAKDATIADLVGIDVSYVYDLRSRLLGLDRVVGPRWELPPWDAVEVETEADLDAALEEARSRTDLAYITSDDPRFAVWFRSVRSPARDLAEAVATYADLDVQPLPRKVYHLRAVLAQVDACAAMSLDRELWTLAASIVGTRRAAATLARYALDGEVDGILTPLRSARGLARKAISQRDPEFVEGLKKRAWLPVFDRFLAAVVGGDGAAITAAAKARASAARWPPEVLENAARMLGRSLGPLDTRRLDARHPQAEAAAWALAGSGRGPYCVEGALEALAEEGIAASRELVLAVADEDPRAEWLWGGPPDGWFWFPRHSGRAFLESLRKLVAVGPVALEQAAEGAGIRGKVRGPPVPTEVVLAAIEREPGWTVQGGVVDLESPQDRGAWSPSEAVAVAFLERRGPVVALKDLRVEAIAAGLHPANARAFGPSLLLRRVGSRHLALRSRRRGTPPWTELRPLSDLALAVARVERRARLGIRVAGGTWTQADIGADVAADMRALARGADAVALARWEGRDGVFVVAERRGASMEAWASPDGGWWFGPEQAQEEPLWLG